MYTVYGMKVSGNCYKVQLLLEQLGQDYRWIEVDSAHGGTRTADFLEKNPNGKVPILEVAPGKVLPESNAILCYLAEGSAFLPADRWQRAQVLQWMFFEQYSHEPYIAVARFWAHFGVTPTESDREARMAAGVKTLAAMESYLGGRRFLVAERYSIADIALYAYTHVADEGGFDLEPYPAIRAWLGNVAAQPGHVTIGA